jgi:hypothetical protein
VVRRVVHLRDSGVAPQVPRDALGHRGGHDVISLLLDVARARLPSGRLPQLTE